MECLNYQIIRETDCYIGGTGKKKIFSVLFRLPRNLGLKFSFVNKSWCKNNCLKIDYKYTNFDVEIGQKYASKGLFF